MDRRGRRGQVSLRLSFSIAPLFDSFEALEALAEVFCKRIIARLVLEEVVDVHWTMAVHGGNSKEREPKDGQRHCASRSGQSRQVIYSINLIFEQAD